MAALDAQRLETIVLAGTSGSSSSTTTTTTVKARQTEKCFIDDRLRIFPALLREPVDDVGDSVHGRVSCSIYRRWRSTTRDVAVIRMFWVIKSCPVLPSLTPVVPSFFTF